MRRCLVDRPVGLPWQAPLVEQVDMGECVPLRLDTVFEFSSAGSFKRVRYRCQRCGDNWVEHSEVEAGDIEAAFGSRVAA